MQKINLKTQFALLLAVAVAPFAGISAAELLDNNLYGSVNTDTSINANARLTGSSTVEEDQNELQGNINAGTNANVNTDRGDNAEIRVNRGNSAEVTGNANTNIPARITPMNVMTRSDLRAYAAGEISNNENLTHINFETENIEVGYKQPGKLLGVIPVTLNARAIVASDGRVLIHYPWYRFLVATEKADIQADIDREVSSYLNATTPITFTPGIQAELAAKIIAILEANLMNSGITATSTATGNTSF